MSNFILIITIISGFLYCFGLGSLFIKEKLYLSETLVSTLFGFVLGQFFYNERISNLSNSSDGKFSVADLDGFMMNFSRIVISLQVVAVGISVPKTFLKKELRSLFVLLVPLMLLSFLTSSLIVYYTLGVNINVAFLIGACVTPTDPVLATAVLKGKFADRYIPKHLINLLLVESGANDGLGFLLLTFPLICIKGQNLVDWFTKTWLKEIGCAILIGAAIGYSARKILYFSKKRGLIDKESFLVSMITLGIFVTGTTALLESDDILACFVSGLFFSWDQCFLKEIRDSHLLEVIDLLFNHTFFIFFGFMMHGVVFKPLYLVVIALIILIRRLPFFFLLKKCIPQLKSNKEAFFAGWFGPIGVGAVFFAYHTIHELDGLTVEAKEHVMPLVRCIVFGSIFVHGLTAPIIHFHLRRRNRKTVEESDFASEYTVSNLSNAEDEYQQETVE